jgi:predicted O-methyltransferase YrrM
MIPVAEENFASRPEGSRIDFRTGDADKVLDRMIEEQKSGSAEPFDFVFIDAGKSHYREFFDRAEQLTRPGSVIVCDNILMHGWTVDRSYEGARRHRTNVKYMRMFIDYINEREDLTVSLLSSGDGLAVIRLND